MKHKEDFRQSICFILLIFTLLIFCFNCNGFIVSADMIVTPTLVLEDLQKDSSFNINDYPVDNEDNSLKVIQIAESANNELLVYVYQPSALLNFLQATSINVSSSADADELNINNYSLSLLSHEGVFGKYKVNNFTVNPEVAVRYYTIVSIFRNWNEDIDLPAENNNTITEVAYEVGQKWSAFTVSTGETFYRAIDVETVEITDKYVGFVRIMGANEVIDYDLDRYFVAFSCNRNIDKLISADVYYQSQEYILSWDSYSDKVKYKDIESHVATLNAGSSVEWVDNTSFWKPNITYIWEEIQSAQDFLLSVDLNYTYQSGWFNTTVETKINEESMQEIANKQWVLNFASFERLHNYITPKLIKNTIVSNVTILRLMFESEGKVYNLGVVDNKQTPTEDPDVITQGSVKLKITIPDWLKIALAVVFVIVCFVILVAVAFLLSFLVKGIIYLINKIRE